MIVPLDLEVEVEGQLITERRLVLPPPVAIADPTRRVDVAGVLVRAGEPVSGARVRMHSSSATTRGDGSFDLRGVPAGTRGVLVAGRTGTSSGWDADPVAGETPEGERLALDLANAISDASSASSSSNAASNGSGAGNAGDGSEEG